MSDEIKSYDSHEADLMGWHKKTTVLPSVELQCFDLSEANFTVEKMPHVFGRTGQVAEDVFDVVATKGGKEYFLATVSDVYQVFTNSQLAELVGKVLKGIDHKITDILTIKGLKQCFITVSLNNVKAKNGDEFKENVIFATSHDGSMRTICFSSFIRVVCANTARAAMQSKGVIDLSASHTNGGQAKLEGWGKQVDQLMGFNRDWFASYSLLTEEQVGQETATQFFTGFLSNGKPLAKKSENQRETLVSLFNRGKGNRGETKADLLNSITEFYTHGLGYDEKTVARDPWKVLESSEGGKGAEAKSRAFDLLTSRQAFQDTVLAGKNSLALAVAN